MIGRPRGRVNGRALALLLLAACAGPDAEKADCALRARPRTAAVGFDANSDGVVDVADGAWLLARNFRDGADPPCLAAVEAYGDAVTDVGTAWAIWYALISGTAEPTLADGACAAPDDDDDAACGDGLALAVDAPATASGEAGGTATIDATVTLTSPALPVEAWSISLAASGCTVTAASVPEALWPAPPHDGARVAMAQASTGGGAVSLTVLDPVGGTTIRPDATPVLTVRLAAPVGADCSTCALSLVDGQVGRGRPLTNAVSSAGRSYAPETTDAAVRVCPAR